ncbi:3948_t:CDS:2 [Dentiscutata heterogama]|uniref:3948_t:CDS:1 n=1 Tax=Dentiscutata heterogama TaxID=1316150 RepID=A0ACA9K748_9GLOM|nr:3948_t:CDS:2 [Dentiscutata heterogama]
MAPPKPPKSPSINPTSTLPPSSRGISITIPQSKPGYEKPIRNSKTPFSVDEYEVFKVSNKLGFKIPE